MIQASSVFKTKQKNSSFTLVLMAVKAKRKFIDFSLLILPLTTEIPSEEEVFMLRPLEEHGEHERWKKKKWIIKYFHINFLPYHPR